MKSTQIVGIILILISLSSCNFSHRGDVISNYDKYHLKSKAHLVHDYPAINSDGSINVIIEIPAGTAAKWEVHKESGDLKWEFKNNKARIVNYLAYPANYGMIPQTILPKELGGDGDPLDVIVLGPALARGSHIEARLIGMLKLLDGGEQDDKCLAVTPNSSFSHIHSIDELNQQYPGVLQIIELWFSHYKGPNKMAAKGFVGPDKAYHILQESISAYKQ
ncbi:MAG: inorganic diphosphatase [Planctomycetes bacterium]|nr:inorganic diphosphatase [Planctomycetota bacterium]